MARRLVGSLLTAVVALAVCAAPAQAAPIDFTGIVALNNCSGSLVRTPKSAPGDRALVMSNGHCVKFMGANEVIVNQASSRTFTLLTPTGGSAGTLRAARLAYATMSGTDVSLYQLNTTYAQIEQQYKIRALELSTTHPVAGSDIKVVSGYWKRIYTCKVDGFAYQLKEAQWTWKDSIRYTQSCNTIGGTSGSPVVDVAGGKVVGVNNTGNESGERCTLNNPCEVDQSGAVTVRKGTNYGQETFHISACFGPGTTLNLSLPGCTLPKPQS
ncbi:serine protease [Lentzea sp. NBRC 105346]|uniref:S1 family peptidase n=1 Tax=Lentzea sp. NBRC 105346 TaxID=3032205 RepID=UPI0025572DBC|nr:serine protease [Lentzea sp. NBRC 105346]